ncbi:receptor-type tyrosine-protein phosphatase zeta precursor [Xenopus tropicalis]|uniref:Receptor-type tyrosine-protein phosphatase zeta n=1 Tax=Xenopus tropicalis TaxID=8364 RepID=A0A8J0QI61_XENTR|nr:receptor-type tyrosine-protein phosphatase zeta precursor [Xenopus tropicalis]
MLNPRCFLACLQLLSVWQVGLPFSYYRQQRKLTEEIDWSYTETLNQENWVKKYPVCNGAKQSPINIDEDLTQLNTNLKKLHFEGWDKESSELTLIRNTGKTVEINLTDDYYLSGGALDSQYKASRITFHWGKCNATSDGSEHSLEGQKFPLEMQIFCFNHNEFKNIDEAISGNGKIKALSILFKVGQEDNVHYNEIIDGVDNVHRFGTKVALGPFILSNLLPDYTDKYYTYNGSLTTPPCSETVEWIVFKDTVTISESQLEMFCEILTMQQSGYVMVMDYLQNNYRHQQYKFSGQVFSSYTGTEEIPEPVCSSEPEDVRADSKNNTSLLITWRRPRVVYDAVIERYLVFYQHLEGEDQTKHEYLTDGYQDLGAIIYNLVPNTSYVLQVVAICTNGLYGKRSDQVIVDMTVDAQGTDQFTDFTETEEDIEDSEEVEEENENKSTRIFLSTVSSTNQKQAQGGQATTSSYSEEITYVTTVKTEGDKLKEHRDVLKAYLYPTLQTTTKTMSDTTVGSSRKSVEHAVMPQSVSEATTYLSKDFKSRVEIWMLNISDSTQSVTEEDEQTSADSELHTTTTSWKRRILIPTRNPKPVSNHTTDTTPPTVSATFVSEITPQGNIVSSDINDYFSSTSEDIAKVTAPVTEFDLYKISTSTSTSNVPVVSEEQHPTDSVSLHIDELLSTSLSSGATVLQATASSLEEMNKATLPGKEMLPVSNTTFSTPEALLESVSASFGHHDSESSVSEVLSQATLSQTTQPVSNGEIPLQPSFTSEVFPLVTPLLSDNKLLKATLATSDIDLILHATPVFPSVDVSVEPSLSYYDGAPLLAFSSASSTSKVSPHLYTVSELFSQVPTDTLSLHASLVLTESNALLQPSHTYYSDVKPHQTTFGAHETLTFDHGGDTFKKSNKLISHLESPNTELKMHALSTVSELTSPLSSDMASSESFAVSYDSSAFVHDTVGIFHQGTIIKNLGTEVLYRPSTISVPDISFQPTQSILNHEDSSDTFSGSGFYNGIDDLKVQEVVPSVSAVGDLLKTIEFIENKKVIKNDHIGESNTGLQAVSAYGPVTLHAGNEEVAGLSSSDARDYIFKVEQSSQETPPLSFSTPRSFDADINAASENLLPVKQINTLPTTSANISLTDMLPEASAVSAFSNMLLSPTQELFYEVSDKAVSDFFFQNVSQSSDVSISSNVTHAELLNDASRSYNLSSNIGSLLLPSPSDNSIKPLLHSTYVTPVGNALSPDSVESTVLQQSVLAVHNHYVVPHLSATVNSGISYVNDKANLTLDIVPSFFSSLHAISTPVLPTNTLTQDTTLNYNLPSYPYATHGTPAASRTNKDISYSLSTDVTVHSLLLPTVYVSVTAGFPKSESPSTLTMLTATSQTSSDILPTVSSDAKMGPSVVDDGFIIASTYSTSHTETQGNVVADNSSFVHREMLKNKTFSEHSEQSEDGSAFSTAAADNNIDSDMEGESYLSTTMPMSSTGQKHIPFTAPETHIQTLNTLLENTSESRSWAVLTDEESGSGPSTSDSLSDNETSTDFNFSDINDRDKDYEVAIQPGKADLTPGSEMTSPPSVTSERSPVVNVSEADVVNQEASNSSHESRVGLAEGLESEEKTVIPLVVVSSLTFICLVVLVGILIYWRKCFQTAHFYLEDNASSRVISSPPIPVFPVADDVEAIPLKQFPKHVEELHSRNGFTDEFEEIQNCTADLGITSDNSNHPDNKNKNRYVNIVAYDHSRVKLSQLGEKEGKATDYINANFVDGYNKQKAYIAAQGPLKSTAEDFWRMLWEHNVEVIVMITNLVEKGRRKCDQYWPSDGSEEYGSFLVTHKNTKVLAYYTVRTFILRNNKIKKGSQKGRHNERTVVQYHYTQWPDMGVPEYTLPVLTFVRKASATKCNGNGPVVVHCSAGVGRTGTYIVLDSMLKQIQHEGTVNIFGFLKHIRSQRNYLVQTEEQYIFIHDALVEAILSRETEVPESHIHGYVNTLLTTGPSGKSRLETQFKLLSEPNILQCDYSMALKPQNRDKNRTSSIIPVERSRVGLSSLAGEGTDYINASYVMGYHESNQFIITQHPLLHTIKDFWRMMWDHNSQLIVMLPDNQNMAEDEFVYWPNKDQPIMCDTFTVSLVGEDHMCLSNEEKLIIQDFILEATQDDYVLEVRHFQCPKWPNPDSPISKTFEIINLIKEEATNKDGTIIVHDEYGGVTAGTFCALYSLMHQLEQENSVDIYQLAKMINLMRPGIFTDIEQYQFLYKAMLSLVSTRQEEDSMVFMDTNGASLPDGSMAESLESLV